MAGRVTDGCCVRPCASSCPALIYVKCSTAQGMAGCPCAAAGARGCRRLPPGSSPRAAPRTTAAAGTLSGKGISSLPVRCAS